MLFACRTGIVLVLCWAGLSKLRDTTPGESGSFQLLVLPLRLQLQAHAQRIAAP